MSPYDLARSAAQVLRERGVRPPRVGLVLGSGLGAFADTLEGLRRIPYTEIPGFRAPTIAGHAGNLCLGRWAGLDVAALQGRIHCYEGHDVATVVHPTRVLAALGIEVLVLTNAAGGIRADLAPGDLMLLRDHINLMGVNPLRGENDDRVGPRFVDLTQAYDPELREAALAAARACGVPLCEGVYAALAGPSYETPAEIRYLRAIGADAVGMSTVPEVLAARHAGVRVVGISCITNLAAGLGSGTLSHDDVEQTARAARARFQALLGGLLEEVARRLPRRAGGEP
jgi:purine-nucleoside phosphorylase